MQRHAWIGLVLLGIGAAWPAASFGQSSSNSKSSNQNLADPALTAISSNAFMGDVPKLAVQPQEPASVYAPPEPEHEIDGINKGGVNIDLAFRYLTDDVYRGISHNFAVADAATPGQNAKRHASNFETDAKLEFNLSKFPHPYVGVFANVNDSDPVSRFQEIRPFAGVEYTLRPININAGVRTYIYPEREKNTPSPNTSETYVRITIDDGYLLHMQKPVISPYIEGDYDFDKNHGWYLEAGLKHDFELPDYGVRVTPYADVAWISHLRQQFIIVSPHSNGFQHYDIGLTGSLSINHLLHLPIRYGDFSIEGYLTYTGKFDNTIIANNELWGGVGLQFRY